MAEFLVVEVDPAERRVVLADGFGKLHLARLAEAMPEPGATLHGCKARLGSCLLAATGGVRVYQTVFEAVDCRPEPHATKPGSTDAGAMPAARRPAGEAHAPATPAGTP